MVFVARVRVPSSLNMSKKVEKKGGDDSATDEYAEGFEAASGACAADYFAVPGVNRPAQDGKGLGRRNKSRTDMKMERRLRKLEKAMREGRDVERRERKKTRGGVGARFSPPPSDSSSDSSDSSSSESSGSSSSSPNPVRGKGKKSGSKKRTKYDRKHQLGKDKPLKKSETIVVCLVKLLKECYQKGRSVSGLIDHLLVVAEKADWLL